MTYDRATRQLILDQLANLAVDLERLELDRQQFVDAIEDLERGVVVPGLVLDPGLRNGQLVPGQVILLRHVEHGPVPAEDREVALENTRAALALLHAYRAELENRRAQLRLDIAEG